MQKRITSLLLLMLGKSLWDSIVFAQKCSKEYMKISSSTFYCPGKKKKQNPELWGPIILLSWTLTLASLPLVLT